MKAPPLTFGTKLAYGSGQIAEGLKNTSIGAFVMFYYNQVFDLPGTLAGLALGIALIFDAFTDPLAGSLSDNWRSRFGRRHPFMYASALPLAVCFYALFVPPAEHLSQFELFLWLTGTVILTRAAMTLYHVPHIALGAELSDDYEERTAVVSYRLFLGTMGGLAAYVIGFGIFFRDTPAFPRGQFNVDAYGPFALVLGVLMVVTIWWSAWGTRHRVPYLPKAPEGTARLTVAQTLARVWFELTEALKNRGFRWLFGGVLIVFLMVGVDGALNLYMYTYFWEVESSQIVILSIATPVGIMIGAPLTKRLHRLVDKRPGVMWGTAWWAACQIVPVVLRLQEMFPENGTAALVTTLATIKLLQGIGVVQALVSFPSMVADIVDENELKTGKRQEGIFFGAVSFSSKATSGLGNIVAGVGLDLIAWPRGIDIQTAADVPAQTIVNLGVLYGPVVAGFAVVSVWCYTHHKLDRKGHAEIVVALEARHAAAAGSLTKSG